MFQDVVELGKLGIISSFYVNGVPISAQCFENTLVSLQHFNKLWFKILCLENCIFRIFLSLLIQTFFYFVIIKTKVIKVVDVKIWSDKYTVIFEHSYHVHISITESADGSLKGIETAFQSFYQSILANTCQAARNQFRIIIESFALFW